LRTTFYKENENYATKLRLDGIIHLHFKKGDNITITTYKQLIAGVTKACKALCNID
jgi:hypothetical protein